MQDKRDRAACSATGWREAMAGRSQAALARSVGVDRSTISQLLAPGTKRLPNAQVVAECRHGAGCVGGLASGVDRPARTQRRIAGRGDEHDRGAPRADRRDDLCLAPRGGGLQDPPCARDLARHAQTRSSASAIPCPPPMHMVTIARRAPARSISAMALTTRMAPVAPTGWPSAMAPPFGFTRAGSSPSTLLTASACAAKASFDSIRSKSASVSPVRASSAARPEPGQCP
jgi:hypothetical protein